ncbi:ABC transporter permease [Caulobacter henricii]|uniref:ABC transporter permease n=1 Tax=Caulobacter henricii TaxID=69395 RepID=A0A0P0NYA1_9CAUL|nr:DUF3526 domain-containing protein [Caulobacter henricii]ALL13117.1 ABC transporter permease [Caulobacter henricii]
MNRLRAELILLLRARVSCAALLVLLAAATLAVAAGLAAQYRQVATIARVAAAHQADLVGVARTYGKPDGDAGYAAYYTFHLTADPPRPLAFAALGQRDLQPFVLRVRLLGLQAQLHETEAYNPELVLPGPFDWTFVLIYLSPLVLIALLHDLVSSEREAGRLRLLAATPGGVSGVWGRRAGLRGGLVLAALLLPLWVGAVLAGASPVGTAMLTLAATLYVTFWLGLSLLVAAIGRRSATNAASLIGLWLVLTLLGPALGAVAIARSHPVGQGMDLSLAQREAVHRAWDIPKYAVMTPFKAKHPEWRDTPPVVGRFHWKWYYAMHEMGDDSVAEAFASYRASLKARAAWTDRLGWVLPAAALQSAAHQLASTDLEAHLAYQVRVVAFHRHLQAFYYPYIFNERPFTSRDFERLPRFATDTEPARLPRQPLAALGVLALLSLVAGAWALRRAPPEG